MLCVNASAFTFTDYARNAYDFEPIVNAYITIYCNETNETLEDFTDTTGKVEFFLTPGNCSLIASKPGYNDKNISFEIVEAGIRVQYMTYTSASNTKLVYTDLTLEDHQYCFYDDEGGRFVGCYGSNDTILLSEGNYSIYPKMSMIEQAGMISTAEGFIVEIVVFIIVLLIALMGVGSILMAGFYLLRKTLRK